MEKKYKTLPIFDLKNRKKAADSAELWLRSPREGERYSLILIKIGDIVGRADEKLIKIIYFYTFSILTLWTNIYIPVILMVWRQQTSEGKKLN